jgi:uncharacterized protein (TIRG00374 family)
MTFGNMLKSKTGLLLRSALSIILVGGLAHRIGSAEILTQIRGVHWEILALVVVTLASHVLFVTPRWATILSVLGYGINASALMGSVFLGFLFNQVLPTAVGGDAYRVWRAKQLGVPLDAGIHSVLLDRAFGVLVVLAGTILLLPFASLVAQMSLVWPVVIAAMAGVCLCAVLWALGNLRSAAPLVGRLQQVVAKFNADVHALARRPRAVIGIILLSIVGQLIVVAAIGLLAMEMQVRISLVDLAVISFGAMLAAAIPISLAGWGVREGALVFLFGLYGVPAGTAFAISILFGACLVIASSPGILVLIRGASSRQSEEPQP